MELAFIVALYLAVAALWVLVGLVVSDYLRQRRRL